MPSNTEMIARLRARQKALADESASIDQVIEELLDHERDEVKVNSRADRVARLKSSMDRVGVDTRGWNG